MMSEPRKRKTKGPNFSVYVAVSFPNETFCEIEQLSQKSGLAKAQLVRELFLRGLAAYHHDGKLTEIAEPDQGIGPITQFVAEGVIDVAA
jgi:hypothetical protein